MDHRCLLLAAISDQRGNWDPTWGSPTRCLPLPFSTGACQRESSPACLPALPPPGAAGTLKGNWEAFWGAVQRDHAHAALIWNEATRAELREALQVGCLAVALSRRCNVVLGVAQGWPVWTFQLLFLWLLRISVRSFNGSVVADQGHLASLPALIPLLCRLRMPRCAWPGSVVPARQQ